MPDDLPDNLTLPLGVAARIPLHLTLVRPGRFFLGSNGEDADDDEKPVHEVSITQPFYLGTFPVTQAQWTAVFPEHRPFLFRGPTLPAENVSWHDIVDGSQEDGPPEAFLVRCNRLLGELPEWAGYAFRLPTEAEWEYAVKGGHLAPQDLSVKAETEKVYGKYAGGDVAEKAAWCDENSYYSTHPVGRKQPNQLGLYDLSGNVYEWCADEFASEVYSERAGKLNEDPISKAVTDGRPYRVLRGGSWLGSARFCRLSYRRDDWPGNRDDYYGFRLVLAQVRAGE